MSQRLWRYSRGWTKAEPFDGNRRCALHTNRSTRFRQLRGVLLLPFSNLMLPCTKKKKKKERSKCMQISRLRYIIHLTRRAVLGFGVVAITDFFFCQVACSTDPKFLFYKKSVIACTLDLSRPIFKPTLAATRFFTSLIHDILSSSIFCLLLWKRDRIFSL